MVEFLSALGVALIIGAIGFAYIKPKQYEKLYKLISKALWLLIATLFGMRLAFTMVSEELRGGSDALKLAKTMKGWDTDHTIATAALLVTLIALATLTALPYWLNDDDS